MQYKKDKTYYTDLTSPKRGSEQEDVRNAVKSGCYYIFEIVRPNTEEARALWGLDGARIINGVSRIVSTQKMYVSSAVKHGSVIEFTCSGMDNFSRRADGVYVYYQTPDTLNKRDTYILSFTRLLGRYDK